MEKPMKLFLMPAMVAVLLVGAVPADAAGCIKGAVVGGVAAHVTHHSTLLGALGGCIVGKIVAHQTSLVSYADATGKLLGSDAELNRVAAAHRINVVKMSTLKGYVRNDARTQAAINNNPRVKALDSEISADASLTAALKSAGFTANDVIAISPGTALSGAMLIVNA